MAAQLRGIISFIKGTICDNGLRASSSDVNITFPVNGTWVMANTFTRISGEVNTTEIDYDRVDIRIEQRFKFRDQNNDGKNEKQLTSIEIFKYIIANEGFFVLYSGFLIKIVNTALKAGIKRVIKANVREVVFQNMLKILLLTKIL